jgi:hypothetical protein
LVKGSSPVPMLAECSFSPLRKINKNSLKRQKSI